MLAPAIAEATAMSASWWTPLAAVATFGSGLLLGASTFHADTRWVKRAASANAILYVVVILLWWPAWNGEHVTDFTLWISNFPGVASLAAAAAWRPAAAVVHLFLAATLAQLTNHIIRTSPTTHLLVPDLAFAWTFCAVFVAAAVMALRTGRVLDATIATTHAAAAGAAAAEAKSVERERFDALIHDTVMSTLLAASRNDADPSVIAQARRTVERLDELRSGTDHETILDFDGILAQLRSAASEVDESVAFETAISSGSDPSGYAPDSIRAIAGAMAEALRNSVKHAGSSARRSVTVTATTTRLEVVVEDDGVGFDPSSVETHRLGITVSIRGRMRQLDGGSATIRSSPGRGTSVTLTLSLPAAVMA
ncbi:sensor histidine kinase [Rhodococcus erythropolis]